MNGLTIKETMAHIIAGQVKGQHEKEIDKAAFDLHDAGFRPIGGIIQMLRNEDEEPYEILYYRLKKELEDLWNAR